MAARLPYDSFAEIYDAWVDGVPVADEMCSFYVELLTHTPEPVVELGVGNGRICVEAARQGRRVVGVDSSAAILELCASRARETGVSESLELVQADFRDFELSEPASLVALPFHSIGHLADDEEKLRCMRQIFSQLKPGGRFAWDHFVFDPDFPIRPGDRHLRASLGIESTGGQRRVWETSTHLEDRRLIEILVEIEDFADDDQCVDRRQVRLEMSWLEPERSREMLGQAGFEIEHLFGDFERGPFTPHSSHQVWIAAKPA